MSFFSSQRPLRVSGGHRDVDAVRGGWAEAEEEPPPEKLREETIRKHRCEDAEHGMSRCGRGGRGGGANQMCARLVASHARARAKALAAAGWIGD